MLMKYIKLKFFLAIFAWSLANDDYIYKTYSVQRDQKYNKLK